MNQEMNLGFSNQKLNSNDIAMQETSEARAIAEVQAQYVIAKKFPRNQHQAYMNIIDACKRPFLCEHALYAYPRGGTMVSGPSIRLAEVAAMSWGNVDCGVREISQSNGVSVAEAYAIDLETNTRVTKIFHVPHSRDTKKGKVRLVDSRDIYEAVANQGARRLRACILAIIPGDIMDAAVAQCKKTMESSDIPVAERIRNMIKAFDELGVKVEHLEKRLGHNLDVTIPTEIVALTSIYRSIKDGMATREQFFDIASTQAKEAKEEIAAILKKPRKLEVKDIDPETGEIIPE